MVASAFLVHIYNCKKAASLSTVLVVAEFICKATDISAIQGYSILDPLAASQTINGLHIASVVRIEKSRQDTSSGNE